MSAAAPGGEERRTDAGDGGRNGGSGASEASIRGLWSAQLLGSLDDHAWRVVAGVLLLGGMGAVAPGLGSGADLVLLAGRSGTLLAFGVLAAVTAAVSLLALPLFDRFGRRPALVGAKLVELLLAVLAVWALWRGQDVTTALLAMAALGCRGAVFGVAKYAYLPEGLAHRRLSRANGRIEAATFTGILVGSATGGVLVLAVGDRSWLAAAALAVVAAGGLAAALSVPRIAGPGSAGPSPAMGRAVGETLGAVAADRVLWLAAVGSVVVWSLGALVLQQWIARGISLFGSGVPAALPPAFLLAGAAIGSVAAGRISGDKVEYGLLPLGGALASLLLLAQAAWTPGVVGCCVIGALLGIAGGLLIVPLDALVQWRAPAGRTGAVIALVQGLGYAAMVAALVGGVAATTAGLSPRWFLLAVGLVAAAGTGWAVWRIPDAFLRLLLVLVTHSIYRLRVVGARRVPQTGGALLVPNHVSLVDGLLLLASTDRPIRFVIDSHYYEHGFLHPFLRSLGAIPVNASGGPRQILRALRRAGEALDDGEVVCIFPEGRITRTGALQPFRRGFRRVVEGREAPVVPVYLDRIWGSVFSYARGRFRLRVPRRLPQPVSVAFGEPISSDTPVADVQQRLRELGAEAWTLRRQDRPPLHHSFVSACRRHPLRALFADGSRQAGSLKSLVGAVALARALRDHWRGQRRVGVLLPPSVPGALVNLAATLSGRVVVNLNYSSGTEAMSSAVEQAGLETVVTSGMFVAKAELDVPEGAEPIWIEDVAEGIGLGDRVVAVLLALLPVRWIERACGAEAPTSVDDPVTIVFSSGTTGAPKGVVLSHFNIDSNLEAVAQVLQTEPRDRLLGILPFFHSFGYMATLWLPIACGFSVVYYPNPLDAKEVGELIHRHRLTFLIATPTFLQLYLRRCPPGHFGTLRLVIVGAEKMPPRLARRFEETFGVLPLEGYGATECAPVVSVNVPDFRAPGYYQPGHKLGTVGQPLPGVAVRIVEPETGEPRPVGETGMVLVKGPNVMQGYLDRPERTAEVIDDGWYRTGDIGALDEEGFLRITDRLSRFSKIGGEMVPHGKIESALHEAAGVEGSVFAVTSVQDERRGERLAVLHTEVEVEIPGLLEELGRRGLPNLFIPRRDHFIEVDELPVLGSGKLDLRRVRATARAALSGEVEEEWKGDDEILQPSKIPLEGGV